jgi:serine/threonine-protein kinase
VGPYTLVRELGKGTCGVVWLAERRASLATTRFALKFPTTEAVDPKGIRREAQLWVQASGHPNVLPVIEAEFYEGRLVIVTPFAEDGSLRDWLRQRGSRTSNVDAAVGMCSGILAGLAHLHGRRLVHRDLKPANVLLEGTSPRIADFGLARILHSAEQTYTIAGTPAYMAPEAWEGERSEATDLWSVGVMLYELLVGQRPFPDSDVSHLKTAIRDADPPAMPPSIPEHLVGATLKALNKEPTHRYQSADDMLQAVRS